MNLNIIAQRFARIVSPPVAATLKISAGSTQNADYSRTPVFKTFPVTVDVQALSGEDIRHLDGLNISGIMRVAYFNGIIEGLDRPAGKGGDLLVFGARAAGMLKNTTWLCVQPLENWDGSGWTRVAIQLQLGGS